MQTHTWGERITVSVQKAPYELAVVDTMAKALETGALSIDNANRCGPLIQHLIPRQQFLSCYSRYLKKLGQHEAVCDIMQPFARTLSNPCCGSTMITIPFKTVSG